MRVKLPRPPLDVQRTYVDRPHDRWVYDGNYHRRLHAMVDTAARHCTTATSLADLSAGNGLIPCTIAAVLRLQDAHVHLGDVFPGWAYTGLLTDTLRQIPVVDLFVSGETLEHVPDPDAMLAAIRAKARSLLLTTPVDNWGDPNVEHLWAWDRAEVEYLLHASGFDVQVFRRLDNHGGQYSYGLWLAV